MDFGLQSHFSSVGWFCVVEKAVIARASSSLL